jgi:hypothetical protein
LGPLDSSLSLSQLEKIVEKRNIQYVFFAHDSWIYHFRKHEFIQQAKILKSSSSSIEIASFKSKTYKSLLGLVPTPLVINSVSEIDGFPIFIKPDRGQGTVGALKINSIDAIKPHLNSGGFFESSFIACEYLPGDEFTIDCFSNVQNDVIYSSARIRKVIKSGLAIETSVLNYSSLTAWANPISQALKIVGPWFFQVKEDAKKSPKIMEVGMRIAGGSGVQRLKGINLSMLNILQAQGLDLQIIEQCVYPSRYTDGFDLNFAYDEIYVDYDDTLVLNSKVNKKLYDFLKKMHLEKIRINLITRNTGDIRKSLELLDVAHLFKEVIQVPISERKSTSIMTDKKFLFIDDSFRERLDVATIFGRQTLVLDESFL